MVTRDLIEPSGLCQAACHTWRRGTCLSKLDYVFLSRSICSYVKSASTCWQKFGANLDHAAVEVTIEPRLRSQRGRSFPKIYKSDIASERDRLWIREQLQLCERQILQHWDPHLKLDFVKTMLRSKVLELRHMNKFIDSAEEIRREVNSIMAVVPLSPESSNKVEALRLRLAEIEEKETEIMRLRAGVRWREEGEKSTSYFLARFKARSEGAFMHSISLGNRLVKGTKDVLQLVQLFYGRLYDMQHPGKLDDAAFCDNFFANCPTLDREQRALLSRPLDLAELKESLKSCVDSSPGLDGIPYSFYEAFSDPLLKYVLESWTYAIRTGNLASSQKRSCLTLLPKQGKDLSQIGNWRPISLSSCDLKIVTKAYANRLKVILPNIISEDQVAYVPGRDISFNNRVIQCAKRFSISQSLDYCLVSLDAQKAFDSVSHKYLVKVLQAYEFPQEFIDVFSTLYSDLNSVAQVNGFLSKEFAIRRGVKQGDALSCGLFILAIDPLLRNLRSNVHIEGMSIPIGPLESANIKVLSYADDVAIICKNRNLQQIFTEYEKFSEISGLILNASKTEVFNFTQ